MTKRMRELQAQIQQKAAEAKALTEGEGMDLAKAGAILDEVDTLQKELDTLARVEQAKKAGVPADEGKSGASGEEVKTDGFKALAKKLTGRAMTDTEKAMITGDDAANGENYLIPEDVRLAINELRKTYVSAKDLVTVETTDALTGSVNYESGAPAGLSAFDDGDAISEDDAPAFVRKSFKIAHFGKLIPVSRILLGAEKAGLLGYINRWFLKNAVLTENTAIFATLKAGYNEGTVKAVPGWKALKKSIAVDLDPSCLHDGVIVTNQSGFAALDAEEDKDGRPVLQENPANRTQKMFQGMVVHVFPDAQLPNIDATHFPMIYGSLKAGATFVEHNALQFATSEHYGFGKNQNYLRVIEGFDVMSTDASAYVYGSFSASAN